VMLTVGLVLREQRESGRDPVTRTLGQWCGRLRSAAGPLLALTVLGAGLGAGLARLEPVQHAARVDVLLPHTPVYLPPYEPPENNPPDDVTIDSAAAALLAGPAVRSALGGVTTGAGGVTDRARVTAAPNTRVLQVTVLAPGAGQARDDAAALTDAFLDSQARALEDRRARALRDFRPSSYAFRTALNQVPDPGTVLRRSAPEQMPRDYAVYGVSGAALGLLAGTLLAVLRPARLGGGRRRLRHG